MYLFSSTDGTGERGFTLIELLVAVAITGIVIALASSGLYALMSANERSQSETMARLELERALAFITDEIKMSQQIMTTASAINGFQPASGSSRVQPILVLSPALNSKLDKPIVYYLADPPNSSVWLGPRVIYRWGPTLLQNGKYSNGNGVDVSTLSTTQVQYYNEVLIDRIGDVAAAQANVACDSNYSPAPSIRDRLGFYACIAPDRKSVRLWMYKQPDSSGRTQSIDALVSTRSN